MSRKRNLQNRYKSKKGLLKNSISKRSKKINYKKLSGGIQQGYLGAIGTPFTYAHEWFGKKAVPKWSKKFGKPRPVIRTVKRRGWHRAHSAVRHGRMAKNTYRRPKGSKYASKKYKSGILSKIIKTSSSRRSSSSSSSRRSRRRQRRRERRRERRKRIKRFFSNLFR